MRILKHFFFFSLPLLMSCAPLGATSKSSPSTPSQDSLQANLIKKLQPLVPQGFSLRVEEESKPPFHWRGESKKSKGVKIVFEALNQKVKEKSPYAAQSPRVEQEREVSPRLTRTLYTDLESSYAYSMFERIHPDTMVAVTKDYVVIAPSEMGPDADVAAPPALEKALAKELGYDSQSKEFYEVMSDPALLQKIRVEKKIPEIKILPAGKKALVFTDSNPNQVVFGIRTLP